MSAAATAQAQESERVTADTTHTTQTRETRVLGPGMRGEPVLGLQQALKSLGFDPGELDGVYADSTSDALRGFQRREELEATGVFDEPTRRAMATTLAVKAVAQQSAMALAPSGGASAAAVATGVESAASEVLKGKVVESGNLMAAPFWKETWFLLIAGGAAAVGAAFYFRSRAPAKRSRAVGALTAKPKRRRKPRLEGEFDDFEDEDAVAELAAVLEDGDLELDGADDDEVIDVGEPVKEQTQVLNGGEAVAAPKRRKPSRKKTSRAPKGAPKDAAAAAA